MTRHLLAATFALVLLVPGATRAQDAQPARDPSVQLFERGVELLRDGDYAEAAASFRRSYRMQPRVTTMCNLALTYDRWGPEHRAQAVRAYRTCVRDDDTERFRAYAERRIEEIERELVLEDIEAPEGHDDAREPASDLTSPQPQPSAQPQPELQPDPDPAPVTTAREPDHALLYAGIGVAALAAGATIGGVVLALDAQSNVDALHDELGGSTVIVRGSPAHQRLEDARDAATAATALYVGAGVLAATAATLIVIDLATTSGHDDDDARVTLGPTHVALRLRF